MLAVTGSASGASVVFHSHVAASLLADGTNLASKLFAKFQTTSSQFQHQGLFFVRLKPNAACVTWRVFYRVDGRENMAQASINS